VNEQIRVCAWCRPRQTIYDLNPDWENLGLTITHGICHFHAQDMKRPATAIGLSPAQVMRRAMRRNALEFRSFQSLGLQGEARLALFRAKKWRDAQTLSAV